MNPGNLTSMYYRCLGRRHFAPQPPSVAAEMEMAPVCNAALVRILLSYTACGHNTPKAFRNTAKSRGRD